MDTNNHVVLLDEIAFDKDGKQIDFADETNEYWGKANARSNIASRMYAHLYQTGKLNEIADYVCEHTCDDGSTVVNIVIDVNKLDQSFIDEMETLFPGNGLKDAHMREVCWYSGTTGLNRFAYCSYRDWYGTVGRTFEHPFVTGFYPGTLHEFVEIRDTKGPVASAIAVLKTCWKEEGGCTRQTAEEYEASIDAMYEEWDKEYEESHPETTDPDSTPF